MARKDTPLYNEELKNKFIAEYGPSSDIAASCFRNLAKFEFELDKDISTMTDEEATNAILGTISRKIRMESSERTIRVVKAYSAWCAANGVDGAVANRGITKDILYGSLNNVFVRSPAHLQHCLDEVFDSENENTVDNTYRLFLWITYGGIECDDAIALTPKHFDLENMIIEIDNKLGVIYRQALPCLRNCITLTSFRYKHPLYDNGAWKKRVDGDAVLRGTRGNCSKIKSIVARNIIKEKSKNILSYKAVFLAGIFYRIYEQELATGLTPNFLKIATETPYGKRVLSTQENRSKANIQDSLSVIAGNLKEDYYQWKETIKSI